MSDCQKLILAAILPVLFAAQAFSVNEKLTAEQVIQHHLDSIGNAETRTATKSRVVEGAAHFTIKTGGAATLDGKTVIVSEDRKFQLMMKFPNNVYSGERFICDGNKVQVAFTTQTSNRSNFGQFVYIQDMVMREGLLGGELSTAWSLFDMEHRQPKLSYEGLKTIDGKQLHDVKYTPQRSQNIEVHIFFDPETFHHVLTVYTMSIDPQLVKGGYYNSLAIPELGGDRGIQTRTSSDAVQGSRQQVTRYRIEEKFSDFKAADGLTLPNHYSIQFTQEPQDGKTTVWNWDITTTRILENATLDPRNFEVK